MGRLFEGISLDVKNMKNCHHSSMCLRDVEVNIPSHSMEDVFLCFN